MSNALVTVIKGVLAEVEPQRISRFEFSEFGTLQKSVIFFGYMKPEYVLDFLVEAVPMKSGPYLLTGNKTPYIAKWLM